MKLIGESRGRKWNGMRWGVEWECCSQADDGLDGPVLIRYDIYHDVNGVITSAFVVPQLEGLLNALKGINVRDHFRRVDCAVKYHVDALLKVPAHVNVAPRFCKEN